ncbi:hypothetical protein [Georgenia thermotolerans]|uniref:Uncharacterized protein n=1 Tax=Georgenia thermotolerans TaxID=527326 RepID=A0A7J5UM41_9MICO|nr:hypothetical protein [Georgenia thermotolerans]KAE8763432.1 hypothetical protein GB883_14215 [Georgenia thermotolerans]
MSVEQVPLSEQAYSLGPAQYGTPVRPAGEPLPITAWIHTRKGHQLVDGVALAWTEKAVRVRYVDGHGREGFAWVWANAVTRRLPSVGA